MRWPWQRERSEPLPETSEPGAAPPPVAQLPPVPPAGWAFLPPLQRTVGSMELTHHPEHFAGSLAAWSNPSFTGSMGHLVTADAPPGVIDVDGGGTGSRDAHLSGSADMTLLLPPARPGRGGGSTTAVQHTSFAADAPGGASPSTAPQADLEVPSDEPVTMPENDFQPPSGHVAVPAEQPALGQIHAEQSRTARSVAPVQRFAPDTPPSFASSLFLQRQAELPAAPAHGDESVQSAAPEQDLEAGRPAWDVAPVPRPNSADSTSDSKATYVSLPVLPALQRSIQQAGNKHQVGEGTADGTPEPESLPPVSTPPVYPTRLGLGRPLSFSQPEPSVPPTRRAFPGQESAWPLQRTAESGKPPQVAPTSWRLDPGGSAAGKAPGSATEASAPPADSFTDPLEIQEGHRADAMSDDEGASGQQPEKLLLPLEESSAPLLPIAMLPAAMSASGDSGVDSEPLLGVHQQPAPDLPVVSRLTSIVSKKGSNFDDGRAPRQVAGSLLQPDDPPDDGPVASASVPGSLEPARISSTAPHDASISSRGLLGDERAEGSSAQSLADAATSVQRGEYGEPGSAQLQAGSVLPGPVTPDGAPREVTVDAYALKARNTGQRAPLGMTIQRAEAVADAAPQRSGPSTVHLDARISRPVAPAFTSVVWQRLAAKPRTIQQHAGWVPPPASPALPIPGSTIAGINDAGGGSSSAGGGGAEDTRNREKESSAFFTDAGAGDQPEAAASSDTGYGGEPLSADAAEAPGSSAAVGSSIQRTLALNGPAPAPGAGSPAVGISFSTKHVANGAPEEGAPLAGGRTLQRFAAFPVSAPLPQAFPPVPADLRGAVGHPAVDSRSPDPVVLTLATPTPSTGPDPRTGELMNHTYGRDTTVQRVNGSDVPEALSPVAGGTAVAPVEFFPPSSAVEANGVPPPAGDAPPGAERPTAGAPGSPDTATPDQLEELAKRLAGPIIRRIKAEMLLDRERRGLRTDSN